MNAVSLSASWPRSIPAVARQRALHQLHLRHSRRRCRATVRSRRVHLESRSPRQTIRPLCPESRPTPEQTDQSLSLHASRKTKLSLEILEIIFYVSVIQRRKSWTTNRTLTSGTRDWQSAASPASNGRCRRKYRRITATPLPTYQGRNLVAEYA